VACGGQLEKLYLNAGPGRYRRNPLTQEVEKDITENGTP
jgi:hypothetical protein